MSSVFINIDITDDKTRPHTQIFQFQNSLLYKLNRFKIIINQYQYIKVRNTNWNSQLYLTGQIKSGNSNK